MTATKDILKVSQNMQALAIAADSVKLAKKKKKKTKDYINSGFNSMVGTSMLKANADFIGMID